LKKHKDLITNGRAKVNYNRNRGNPYGRSNPDKSLGLFSIRKEIRHTLCKDRFIDIDIDNAPPTVLYQILEEYNIKCDKLKDYVLNPEYFDMTSSNYGCDRDTAKNLFISLLFGGGFDSWTKKFNI
jgi:hypothetical protein